MEALVEEVFYTFSKFADDCNQDTARHLDPGQCSFFSSWLSHVPVLRCILSSREEDLLGSLSSCELGKGVSRTFSSIRESRLFVMGGVLSRSFPRNRRYGRPHRSWSMVLRSSPQERDLASLICNRSLIVTVLYFWCRSPHALDRNVSSYGCVGSADVLLCIPFG